MEYSIKTHQHFINSISGQIMAIFLIRMSASAAFAFFFSGLSLYLTEKESQNTYQATLITGLFLSLNYFLPFIGGFILNNFISAKKLYCIGTILSIAGCILLASNTNLYLGLSLFLMNGLVSNVCLKMILTNLFDPLQKKDRKTAFIWGYVGMNVGFLMGISFSGYSMLYNNYFYLFIFMGTLLTFSTLLTIWLINEKTKSKNLSYTIIFFILIIVLINFLFNFVNIIEKYIIWLSLFMMMYLTYYGYKKTIRAEKLNYLKFVGYSMLTILFWSLYMLSPIAFMQLIEYDVEKKFFNFTIPPHWFINIDSIVILIIAPILAIMIKKNKLINIQSKNINYYLLAFTFCIMALLILLCGLYRGLNATIPMWAILFCFSFFAMGEIFISPIGDSLIGELIPIKLRALIMGYWNMTIGVGTLIATTVANAFFLPYINKNGLIKENLSKLKQNTAIICALLLVITFSIFMYNLLKSRKNS